MDKHERRYALVDTDAPDPIESLFYQSPSFAKVLAGGMTLHTFVDKHADDFLQLTKIAEQKFVGMDALKRVSSEGVVCAWIAKLRFNQEMTDAQFFAHVQKADELFAGYKNGQELSDTNRLDLKNKINQADNDNISLMWGLQALAGKQGYDNGTIRIRLPEDVAPRVFGALKAAEAKERVSTHALLTSIDNTGLGKDLENETHRKYTPMGYGTLLTYRTFNSDEAAKEHSQNSGQMPNDHDLFFKMEDFGYRDKLSHTLLHVLGPIKKLFAQFVDEGLFHHKTPLARTAEKIAGSFEKISRKDHMSALGKENSKALLSIYDAIQKDMSDSPERQAFNDYKVINAFRVKVPWPFERKIVGNGQQLSLASFINQISTHSDYIKQNLGQEKAFEKISALRALSQGSLSDRREGLEVLIDASSINGQSQLKPVDGFVPEPKIKKSFMDKLTHFLNAVKTFFGFGPSSAKVAPEPPLTSPSTNDRQGSDANMSDSIREEGAHNNLPIVNKKAMQDELPYDHEMLQRVSIPLMSMIEEESFNGNMHDVAAMKLLNALQTVVAFPRKTENEAQYQRHKNDFSTVVATLEKEHELSLTLKEPLDQLLGRMDAPIEPAQKDNLLQKNQNREQDTTFEP